MFNRILDKVVHRLKEVFVQSKSDTIRELFYDFMVILYEKSSDYKAHAKSSLIRGLVDEQKSIRSRIIQYWDQNSRLSADPRQRVE